MKKVTTKSIFGLMLVSTVMTAGAAESLPDGKFFTDGQTWHLERTSATGDELTVSNLEVTVDGNAYVQASYTDDGDTFELDELCSKLVVKVNGEAAGEYYALFFNGRILVKSEKKNEFVPMLSFNCGETTKVNLGEAEYQSWTCDYVHTGDLLRKRVKCDGDNADKAYIFGIGAKEWNLSSEYWPGDYNYRLVSMTTAEGKDLDAAVFGLSKAECDNTFWKQDKRWDYYTYYPIFPDQEGYHTYWKVSGEVTLPATDGDMVCPRYVKCESDWSETYPENSTPVVSINGQVYKYYDYEYRFMPEYDFDVTVGEQVINTQDASKVERIDEISVEGRKFKRIVFAGADAEDEEWQYWVEGVGANSLNTIYQPMRPSDGSTQRMEACYEGDKCIFTYADFKGSVGIKGAAVETDSETSGTLYDLQGRAVTSPLTGSVVIRAGKKAIAK